MAKKQTPKDDLDMLLQDVRFRRFILQMLDECGVHNDVFVAGDPLATARESGKRAFALNLYRRLMNEHFEWYVVAMREARGEQDDEKAIDFSSVSE